MGEITLCAYVQTISKWSVVRCPRWWALTEQQNRELELHWRLDQEDRYTEGAASINAEESEAAFQAISWRRSRSWRHCFWTWCQGRQDIIMMLCSLKLSPWNAALPLCKSVESFQEWSRSSIHEIVFHGNPRCFYILFLSMFPPFFLDIINIYIYVFSCDIYIVNCIIKKKTSSSSSSALQHGTAYFANNIIHIVWLPI